MADCVLYDDEHCDGEEGVKAMRQGDSFTNATLDLKFDVESVSVRKGCFLNVYTGMFCLEVRLKKCRFYHLFTKTIRNNIS